MTFWSLERHLNQLCHSGPSKTLINVMFPELYNNGTPFVSSLDTMSSMFWCSLGAFLSLTIRLSMPELVNPALLLRVMTGHFQNGCHENLALVILYQ